MKEFKYFVIAYIVIGIVLIGLVVGYFISPNKSSEQTEQTGQNVILWTINPTNPTNLINHY